MSLRFDRLDKTLVSIGDDIDIKIYGSVNPPSQSTLGPQAIQATKIFGPVKHIRTRVAARHGLVPSSLLCTIAAILANDTIVLSLNGFRYRFVAGPAPVPQDAITFFVTEINADPFECVTALQVSPTEFRLTPKKPYGLTSVGKSANIDILVEDPLSADISTTTWTFTYRMSCYAKQSASSYDAESLAFDWSRELTSPRGNMRIVDAGFTVGQLTSPQSLPMLRGTNWESRSDFQVTFRTRDRVAWPKDSMAEVGVEINEYQPS